MSIAGLETGGFTEAVFPGTAQHGDLTMRGFAESPAHARDRGLDPYGTPVTVANFFLNIEPIGGVPAGYFGQLIDIYPSDNPHPSTSGSAGAIVSHSGPFQEFTQGPSGQRLWIVGLGAGFSLRSSSSYSDSPYSIVMMLPGSYHFAIYYQFSALDFTNFGKQMNMTAQIVSASGQVIDVTPAGPFNPSASSPSYPYAGRTMSLTGDFSSTAAFGNTNWFWLQFSFNGTILDGNTGGIAPESYDFNLIRTGP